MNKILKTREALLEKEQLKKYLAQIASNTTVTKESDIKTYPIKRVKENYDFIYLVYKLLNEHSRLNITIHPAGEWLLDNYYIIEKSIKSIIKDLPKNKYTSMPGIKNSGFARIYELANEIVINTDGKIIREDLQMYLESYQSQKYLTMEEIWNIGLYLQISIIEKIRNISEKILVSQIQKYKAQNIVERIIENKTSKKINTTVEGKYALIEYLSYKLRKLGKKGIPYINVLKEEVSKSGITIDEIIKREHFDVAVKTLSMKNCITSIKNISRLDITEIFARLSLAEKILCQDPANTYTKMDYKTKTYYRKALLEISKRTKLSEIFIARKIIEICKEKSVGEKKLKHIGYYLIDEGKEELLTRIVKKKIRFCSYKQKARNYLISVYFFAIITTLLLIKPLRLNAIFLYVPIQNAITQIIQYIKSKKSNIRLIPKMDYSNGIPNDCCTMCIIPALIEDEKELEKLFYKMEVYYLANKTENLYFTLLGDCCESDKEKETKDKRIIDRGIELSKRLNKQYGEKFFFIYRKREWSDSEKCFMGWERKRGLIIQFNDFLLTGKSNFLANTLKKIPKVKYVITLDSDTNLILNSAKQLVGAMSHILNKPEVDKIKNIVVKGHGIIQPHVGIDIEEGRKTIFSRLFAGNGGTDIYSNAISNVYQDEFDEGIYTGKGIYDLKIFNQIIKYEIPEKKVLSHDLLEGNYLRCGLASDVVLMDGYPSTYNSYKIRTHRWIRGDIQNIEWLKSRFNGLSKYKILDNIIRSMNEKNVFISYVLLLLTIKKFIWIPILIYSIPTIIKNIDNLINKKDGSMRNKLFSASFSKWTHPIYKFLVDLIILPDIAFLQLDAIIKALYRMKISHCFLLEWTTSDEAEKKSNNNIGDYFRTMIGEVLSSLLLMIYLVNNIRKYSIVNQIIAIALSIMWFSSTVVMYIISKNKKSNNRISNSDKEYLTGVSKKTWSFFKENLINGLPIDNYQEDREEKQALRTSPTNIGLALLSIISSYDLSIENLDETIKLIKNTIETVESLPKWKGHLYNWYDINTLQPMIPLDISSVDSGNFIGYLYVTKQFLIETNKKEAKSTIESIQRIINQTEFKELYNYENGMFSIGYSIEQNKLYDSYYDLLASESRQTSLVAIAKRDIPAKHWKSLGRTLTRVGKHKGLISWGGTAFEYLMPNINIPSYPSTLIDESNKVLIQSNIEYTKKLNIPWGMSESAYSIKDFQGNYQYKTFGLPWLGLKRGLEDNLVISPYSCALALSLNAKESIQNLKKLENEGMIGKYGFYESIDYKPKKQIVKTFMAHHQGMILASIDNLINKNIMQERFMKNPEIQGIKILLQENMPEDVIITKEQKSEIKKVNNNNKISHRYKGINIVSNGALNNMMNDRGENYTKLGDKTIYENMNIYLKNISSNKVYDINEIIKEKKENIKCEFSSSQSKYIIEDGTIKAIINTIIAPNKQVEVKKILLSNKGISEINLEINTYVEPILLRKADFDAHPAYNKMFYRYDFNESKLMVTRKGKSSNEEQLSLCTSLYSDEGILEFEIDKEKYISRKNEKIPYSVSISKQLTNSTDTAINPIIAFRKIITIKPEEKKELYLISSLDKDMEIAERNFEIYCNKEKLTRLFEITKEQAEAELRYMNISEKEVEVYLKIAELLLYTKQKSFDYLNKTNYNLQNLDLSNNRLWKYGISGERPIVVINLKEKCDNDIVLEILKAYDYLVRKNIRFDVVIITTKENKQQILNDKILDYINVSGGIYVLDDLKYEEIKTIELRASLLLNSLGGSLNVQVNEIMEEKNNLLERMANKEIYKNKKVSEEKRVEIEEGKEKEDEESNITLKNKNEELFINEQNDNKKIQGKYIKTKYKGLNYANGFGSFNNEKNEYWIKQTSEKRTPIAWCNLLANNKFGSVITDKGGVYTWYLNSQTNRITRFDNDAYMDTTSERIIINGIDEQEEYYTGYGFGYTHSIKESKEIEQEITTYIPIDNNIKVNILRIKNLKNKEINLDIKYDIDIIMGQNKNNSIIVENHKRSINMIMFKNLMNNKYSAYITSSEKLDSNKEVHIKLKDKEVREVVFLLGVEEAEEHCIEVATKYLNSYLEEYKKTREYWKEIVSRIKSKTPLESLDIMQNGFLVYQTIVSRMLGKTGYYQSSGGLGYRDQLQDAIGMKWVNPEILKNQILLHARHQFEEGDVEHWWHEDSGLGVRSRYSDDLLWLVYAVEEYIDFTGDYSILDEKESFIKAEELSENEKDRVDYYKEKTESKSILEHCLVALKKASILGVHKLPIIKNGDWNDGMDKIGERGLGESVWLGFFLYKILNNFIDILKYEEKRNKGFYKKEIEKINIMSLKIKKALNSEAWDGRWYIRAFNDCGEKIGSIKNEECKIDGICQSFSVISNAGDNDKKIIAMESLENQLIDNENNLIKLLTPALENVDLGYISSYSKGMRENGGQYTHVCCACGQFLK